MSAAKSKASLQVEKRDEKSMEKVPNEAPDDEVPNLNQLIKDLIQQWLIECRNSTGVFPDDPEGGFLLLFSEKDPQHFKIELALLEDSKNEPKEAEKEDYDKEEAEAKMFEVLYELETGEKNYEHYWQDRKTSKISNQRQEVELNRQNIVAEMTLKVKGQMRRALDGLKRSAAQDPQENGKNILLEIIVKVDEQMRRELDELKQSLNPDGKKAGKKKGAKGGKKDKKGGKKGKKGKDLTAERTLESLCDELVEQGLLKQPKEVSIQDYLGDFRYLLKKLKEDDTERIIKLPNVRHLLSLYAVLALESEKVHEDAPQVKAVLLAGPAGLGKKLLVHAICQDTGATLFDLSPANTNGKYPDKPGLALMMHMVFKVAKLRQPSVIWIGETEKMFYKKVPPIEKKSNPKRLQKALSKAVQQITEEDKVLIIGTTNDPTLAHNSVCKTFDQILLVPAPNFSSRRIVWRQLIEKRGGDVTTEELSSLATISDGYTQGQIVQLIEMVLTQQRVQAKTPLMAAEFAPHLAKLCPFREEEEQKLLMWYEHTPQGEKRKQAALKKEEPPTKGKGKGKGAKKKGGK